MRRRIALAAGVLLALALLGVATLGYRVLRGEQGSVLLGSALTRLLPELSLGGLEGSLAQGRARAIDWQQDGVRVSLRGLSWTLAPDCAGLRRVCIARLRVEALAIALAPDGGGSPFPLTPLALPFALELREGSVGTLTVSEGPDERLRAGSLSLAATLQGTGLSVQRLAGRIGSLRGELNGRVELRDRLPLFVQGRIESDGDIATAVTLSARGDLRRLGLRAEGLTPWPFEAEGWIAPLTEGAPLELRLASREPLPLWPARAALGTLGDAELRLEGPLRALHATLDARLDSSLLGENRLHAVARMDEAQLLLQEALLEGAAGQLRAIGSLAIAGERRWELGLELDALHAPGIAQTLDARLDGSARLAGALDGGEPLLQARLALDGAINGLPAGLHGEVAIAADRRVRVQGLELASGPNRLQLAGELGETLRLDGRLAIEDLSATLRGAGGSGDGTLALRGTPAAPLLEARLGIAQPAWQGWRADRLVLEARGDARAVSLEAALEDDAFALSLACDATADAQRNWRGHCAQLTARGNRKSPGWRLEAPLGFSASQDAFALEPFCLRAGRATLCSTERVALDGGGIRGVAIDGDALPLAPLAAWLPADARLEGIAGLRITASGTRAAGLALAARVEARGTRLELPAAGQPLALALDDVVVALDSDAGGVRLEAHARIGATGRVDATLQLQGRDAHAGLAGTVSLAGIDVEPLLRSAAGTLAARGTLDGEVEVGGSVSAPRLAGRLVLADGELAHERLPEPVQDIALTVDFEGPRARIDGHFATTAGAARLHGTANWEAADWSADLRLDAGRLRIEPLRGSTLSLVPALRLRLGPRRAEVRGTLDVPAANIDIATVPQSAARVSDDAVEQGAAAPGARFDYLLDLRVRLGEAVHFRGFGAEARLAGALRLRRAPGGPFNGRGEIRIVDGRYAAWGQRLEVTEGRLLFRGPLDRPGLEIEAVRRIEEEPVTVGVRVRGTARDPELAVFSRPAMPESRALHYLLSGRPPVEGESAGLGAAGALVSLGAAGATRITGGMLGALGIDDFAIGTRSVEGGTEVMLSGYLTPDLYLRYGVSTFDDVNTFRLRYRLTPRFFVEAISGIENAVDFLYSFER